MTDAPQSRYPGSDGLRREATDYAAERTMAFKRIDQEFYSSRKRSKEKLKWFRDNPSPLSDEEQLRNLKRALWD